MPTTRAMAVSQKRTTRSMTAKRKPEPNSTLITAPLAKRNVTMKAKPTMKKLTHRQIPIFPKLHPSTRISSSANTRKHITPMSHAPDARRASASEAEVDKNATDAKTEVDRSQSSDSGTDSIQSWEKEITRWKPGQRPPLRHHPYDLWMNRPTARWGKCGRRLPTPEPKRYSSDEESDDAKMNDEMPEEPPVPRLRGGWLERQSYYNFNDAHDAELGPQLGSIAEEADMIPSDAVSLTSTEIDSCFLRQYYVQTFISSRGNEYFCEIDEDYLTDRFNLTGLNTDVQYYQYALDLVTDVFDLDCDDDMREQIEKSARHLYGLVHARYITTTRGLSKMLDKYKRLDFGKCPRVACASHPLLPTGLSDLPHIQSVKLYCGKCEDLYNPKSSRHATIDGAYFGTSFQNILFQVYPALAGEKSIARYEPRIFGFRVHAAAALERWQARKREEMVERLKTAGIANVFVEEVEEAGEAEEMEEVEDGAGE